MRDKFMPKRGLEFGADSLASAPFIFGAYAMLLLALPGFSATTEVEACASPPDEHFCDRDSDCTIVGRAGCCDVCGVEAYAMSRLAAACRALACRHTECPGRDSKGHRVQWHSPCGNIRHTTPEFFVGVCVNNICERRPKE